MKVITTSVIPPVLRCSGTTRSATPCRGHARYTCVCGRSWCGTHIVRSGAQLRCPSCAQGVALA